MALSELAGKPAPSDLLVDVDSLLCDYEEVEPDLSQASQRVSFGTSGHRGRASLGSFNEAHILAITQAICDFRRDRGISGPLFVGKDTHALSGPAERTAVEVLAANEVQTFVQEKNGFTPTPVISRAIISYNENRNGGLADGIVVTPSHNPPSHGGFKYNPPHGGPAGTDVTKWIEERANSILRSGNKSVKRTPFERAFGCGSTKECDFARDYVADLGSLLDLDILSHSGLKIGVDPLGGASIAYWGRIAERYDLDITVVNEEVDPRFSFMSVDHDGKIRMDCSSAYAMAKLVNLKDDFDIACGADPDSDRHGVVAPSVGLLNPNHFLAVCVPYLFRTRDKWSARLEVGKTLVSSSVIDRVARSMGRGVYEVPVGFKWFVDGLSNEKLGFVGEESAGASFLRKDGSVWSTDKDGIIMGLLASEITASTGRDPGEHFEEIAREFGMPFYRRLDVAANPEEKLRLKTMTPDDVKTETLCGEKITAKLSAAPGNGAAIGGIKIVAGNAWFAARPSGTEDIYKIYAESFKSEEHLALVLEEAKTIVGAVFGSDT